MVCAGVVVMCSYMVQHLAGVNDAPRHVPGRSRRAASSMPRDMCQLSAETRQCKLRRGRATSRRDSYGTVCSCTCCNANIHGYVAIRMGLPTSVRIATWKHRLRRCSYGASRFHASCDGCFAIHMRQAAPLWIATREHLFASQSAGDGPFPTGCDADRGGRHCRVPRSRSHADDAVGDTHRGFAM